MEVNPYVCHNHFDIEGYRITDYKGLVRGITVRSPTISQGILGGLKSIIGGKIGAYTEMCEQARQHAYDINNLSFTPRVSG